MWEEGTRIYDTPGVPNNFPGRYMIVINTWKGELLFLLFPPFFKEESYKVFQHKKVMDLLEFTKSKSTRFEEHTF